MSIIRNDHHHRVKKKKPLNKNENSNIVLKTVNCLNHALGCKLTVSYYAEKEDRPLRMLCYRCHSYGAPGMSAERGE